MAKNKLFSNNDKYESKYYSKKAQIKNARARRKRRALSDATKGKQARTRFRNIMQLISPDDRDRLREYGSRDIFKYSEILLKDDEYDGELLTQEQFDEVIESYADQISLDDLDI